VKYQTESDTTLYMVRNRQPDSKQTMKRGYRTKRDAERFANQVEVSMVMGEYVDEARAKAAKYGVRQTAPVFRRAAAYPMRHTAASLAVSAGANPTSTRLRAHTPPNVGASCQD
jgi:hypothetical protein